MFGSTNSFEDEDDYYQETLPNEEDDPLSAFHSQA